MTWIVSLFPTLWGVSGKLEGKGGRTKAASKPHLCHPLCMCLVHQSLPVVRWPLQWKHFCFLSFSSGSPGFLTSFIITCEKKSNICLWPYMNTKHHKLCMKMECQPGEIILQLLLLATVEVWDALWGSTVVSCSVFNGKAFSYSISIPTGFWTIKLGFEVL